MHKSVFFQEIRFSFDGKKRLETFTKCCCCFVVAVADAVANVATVIVVATAIFIAVTTFIFRIRLLKYK